MATNSEKPTKPSAGRQHDSKKLAMDDKPVHISLQAPAGLQNNTEFQLSVDDTCALRATYRTLTEVEAQGLSSTLEWPTIGITCHRSPSDPGQEESNSSSRECWTLVHAKNSRSSTVLLKPLETQQSMGIHTGTSNPKGSLISRICDFAAEGGAIRLSLVSHQIPLVKHLVRRSMWFEHHGMEHILQGRRVASRPNKVAKWVFEGTVIGDSLLPKLFALFVDVMLHYLSVAGHVSKLNRRSSGYVALPLEEEKRGVCQGGDSMARRKFGADTLRTGDTPIKVKLRMPYDPRTSKVAYSLHIDGEQLLKGQHHTSTTYDDATNTHHHVLVVHCLRSGPSAATSSSPHELHLWTVQSPRSFRENGTLLLHGDGAQREEVQLQRKPTNRQWPSTRDDADEMRMAVTWIKPEVLSTLSVTVGDRLGKLFRDKTYLQEEADSFIDLAGTVPPQTPLDRFFALFIDLMLQPACKGMSLGQKDPTELETNEGTRMKQLARISQEAPYVAGLETKTKGPSHTLNTQGRDYSMRITSPRKAATRSGPLLGTLRHAATTLSQLNPIKQRHWVPMEPADREVTTSTKTHSVDQSSTQSWESGSHLRHSVLSDTTGTWTDASSRSLTPSGMRSQVNRSGHRKSRSETSSHSSIRSTTRDSPSWERSHQAQGAGVAQATSTGMDAPSQQDKSPRHRMRGKPRKRRALLESDDSSSSWSGIPQLLHRRRSSQPQGLSEGQVEQGSPLMRDAPGKQDKPPRLRMPGRRRKRQARQDSDGTASSWSGARCFRTQYRLRVERQSSLGLREQGTSRDVLAYDRRKNRLLQRETELQQGIPQEHRAMATHSKDTSKSPLSRNEGPSLPENDPSQSQPGLQSRFKERAIPSRDAQVSVQPYSAFQQQQPQQRQQQTSSRAAQQIQADQQVPAIKQIPAVQPIEAVLSPTRPATPGGTARLHAYSSSGRGIFTSRTIHTTDPADPADPAITAAGSAFPAAAADSTNSADPADPSQETQPAKEKKIRNQGRTRILRYGLTTSHTRCHGRVTKAQNHLQIAVSCICLGGFSQLPRLLDCV
ncbi:MAG: hypothetical protein Q9159_007476 [Coniocarpon cinnabarinum]